MAAAMVVDHFNTFLAGGAATGARRVHEALLGLGVQSRFWHAPGAEGAEPNASYGVVPWLRPASSPLQGIGGSLLARFRRRMLRRELKRATGRGSPLSELFSAPLLFPSTPYDPAAAGADIVHLHWVANLIDHPSFFAAIPPDFPIVWSLHDMNPLTGGCHYSNGCDAFTRRCESCPQLVRRGEDDLSSRFFRIKRRSVSGKRIHVVAESRWLEQQARRSRMLGDAASIRTIHAGLDTEAFSPQDRARARQALELPADRIVIAFGAESLLNRRKGLSHLFAALALLEKRAAVVALAFGSGRLSEAEAPAGLRMLGFVADRTRLAQVYSAADVFVMPSLEEAFGLTGLEALACGVPVVAFDAGGMVEYVRPPETGLLARTGDAADLARQIQWLIERPEERRRMGEAARRMVVREFRIETEVRAYLELYRHLVKEQDRLPPA